MEGEELADTPLLQKQMIRLEPRLELSEAQPVPNDGDLEGEVTAWYSGTETSGDGGYGYICRTLHQRPLSGTSFPVDEIEHYRFEDSALTEDCRSALQLRWRGLRVRFRAAGRDQCGRRLATEVSRAKRAAKSTAKAPEPALESASRGDVDAALQRLVRKTLKKLGGEATKQEVVAKIKSSSKLLAVVQEQINTATRDSEGNFLWESAIFKKMKRVCLPTGKRREGVEGSGGKIFCMAEPSAVDEATG
mmetsp:Transcript_37703/g.87572  ORF Transcript_37703/g.87572 Transcript_37703/m.87572 type:complete len:248 (-) Transcript_37703:65-808(-)